MRKIGLLVIFMCLASAPAIAADPVVIAAFGDSLFSGYGIEVGQAVPAQIEQKLTQAGSPVTVINDGIAGNTTADGLARVDSVLQQNPAIVIIEFGSNDLLRRISPVEARKNLELIMQRFQQAKIKMILTGQEAPLVNVGLAYSAAYNGIFSELASKYNATLYPSILNGVYGHPDMVLPDGLHPNEKGADYIAGQLAPLVKKLL